MYKDSVITAQNEFIRTTDERIETLELSRNKYKKQRNRALYGGVGGIILSFIAGILVF